MAAAGGGVSAAALAFAAGALGAAGAALLASSPLALVRSRAPRVARSAGALFETVARAGREGRDPAALERRRLLAAGALAALAAGSLVAGPRAGALAALTGPFALARVLHARRERYRAAVEDGAAEIAIAVSDALAGGHSLRGAVGAASRSSRARSPPASRWSRAAATIVSIPCPRMRARIASSASSVRAPRSSSA